jgi:hypothetical protein
MKAVGDDRLIRREFYNANNFPITFTRDMANDAYVFKNGISLGRIRIVCPPDSWIVLDHGFYVPSWDDKGIKSGEVIAHWNFGSEIGKGRKPNRDQLRAATH